MPAHGRGGLYIPAPTGASIGPRGLAVGQAAPGESSRPPSTSARPARAVSPFSFS
ncbi:hypothetical protein SF06_26860 [Pseudomonas flexibilis]|nr:hypothetical protein SF06_26860 [Pseudomonas flexibilis]